MHYMAECRAFFRQFRDQYFTTGSILPSSRALGRALTRPMRRNLAPRRVLEVGPGTGAVTREIVRCLRPGDQFDIVEINGDFVQVIQRRFVDEPDFRAKSAQSRILHSPLQDVPGEADYDFMISGLPLNNFPLALVEDIFKSYQRLLKPTGILSYFEYLAIRNLKMPLVKEEERRRLASLDAYLKRQLAAHQIAADTVPFNVPPAVARHLRFATEHV